MSDRWSPNIKEVPVLKIGDQEAQLYQAAFATFGGSMGVRQLRDDEESWYDQIKGNFMYPVDGAFASPPTTTEGVLRDLGIDPEEKKKKPLKKKKTKVDSEVTNKGTGTSRATAVAVKGTLRLRQRDLDDYVMISDSLEGLSRTAETKTGAGGSKSSGSAGSRNPDAGATPSVPEDEEAEEEDAAAQLIGRKRGRSEATAGMVSAPTAGGIPLVGKTSNLRSLYRFSPEIKKKTPEKGVKFNEPGSKRPKITIKSSDTAAQDAAKAAEAQRKAQENQKREEEWKKKIEEEKRRKDEEERKKKAEEEKAAEEAKKRALEKELEQKKAMDQPVNVQGPEVAKPTHSAHAETHDRSKITTSKGSGRYTSSGASSGGAEGYNPNVIGAKDTVGDIYYKTYTEEERGDAPHRAPWSLKQKDTFQEFGPCREWFLNSFTPAEVNRQRAKPHELLYRTFVLGEANARAANYQIVREWRTMVRERADWEGYRERMIKRIADFDKSKAAFDEEKAKFDADKKAEEWGREGLKNKLQNAEQQLAKEKAEFKRICAQDNERAYAARRKIVDLETKIAELTSKVEEAHGEKAAKQQMEVELSEAKVQLSRKDRDLQAKDIEIAELKRRLNEQIDKCESLEIDLGAEKVANSILNASELDRAVAALTDAARAVGHRGGYLECASHVEQMLGQEFDVSHCSVTEQADAALAHAENSYDNLTLPVMDLVVEALKKDDWCQRLKTILDPPVTVELSDEEPAGDDGEDGDDDADVGK
ncbi:eukaryotic translation initiation factor 5B-like [Helianthus annuus]|uniref:eukaryotic translation initiation factor 5B-like n=1 Tax=Helianthus annuus TaxID=4232 RepID=UPI000B8EFBBB|nr:eukaryotic translation initiation factor 5B-like [Helianthus annuus]